MLKIIQNTWVKIVSNYCIKTSITVGNKPTEQQVNVFMANQQWVQLGVIQKQTNYLSDYISTDKITVFNLLSKSFTHFPHHLLCNPIKEI